MDLNKVKDYISQSKKTGLSEDQIRANLLSVGWKEEDITKAFNELVVVTPAPQPPVVNQTPVSTPTNVTSTTPILNGNIENQKTTKKSSSFSELLRNPKKRIGVIIGGVLVVLTFINFIYSKFFAIQTGQAPTLDQKIIKTDTSKYDKDTDGDGFPDFLETAVGSNANESLYTKCYGNNPCLAADLDLGQYQKDILIILDVSGSMGLKVGTRTRMEEAKTAISRYINSSTDTIKFGLMIYGHKGSNNTSDRALSCANAEIIKQIGTLNKNNVDSTLASITPTGWTNMGTAITGAIPAFASSTAKNKEIILVSDGAETCDSDPESAARKAQNAGIKVGVIGFAVDTTTSNQLKLIATAGGGGYSFANNAEELYSKFAQSYENVQNWGEESKCLYKFLDDAMACYKNDYERMNNYMSQELLKLYKNEITQNEFDKIEEIQNKFQARYLNILKEESDKVNNRLNQNKNVLFKN